MCQTVSAILSGPSNTKMCSPHKKIFSDMFDRLASTDLNIAMMPCSSGSCSSVLSRRQVLMVVCCSPPSSGGNSNSLRNKLHKSSDKNIQACDLDHYLRCRRSVHITCSWTLSKTV